MEPRDLAVPVVTSEQARERDRLAIEAGTPSRALMQNAGVAAAARILHHFGRAISAGIEIHTGPGNNGGDGWVAATELARQGVPVRVVEAEPPRTADAVDARAGAALFEFTPFDSPGVVVDALLGTGGRARVEGPLRNAVTAVNRARAQGARIVSLDIPTGLHASTGVLDDPVTADLTLALGTIKRGHLIARAVCGDIELLDVGLGHSGAASDDDVVLASAHWVAARIPHIPADAHKGTRKRLAIIAGDAGMAGAAALAALGALRSGIGLVHTFVASQNREAVYSAVPAALVSTHEELRADPAGMLSGADAIVVGPGLRPETASEVLALLTPRHTQVVLDAGALSAVAQDRIALKKFCAAREVVLTPHPAEMARLTGLETREILEKRFDIGMDLARDTSATVLLKGTPTIVSHAKRGRVASPTGTAALATGGSGDVLSGMIGTLLAQTGNGFESAVSAAWVHGRAAELCGTVRGVILEDVLFAMPAAWRINLNRRRAPLIESLPFVR